MLLVLLFLTLPDIALEFSTWGIVARKTFDKIVSGKSCANKYMYDHNYTDKDLHGFNLYLICFLTHLEEYCCVWIQSTFCFETNTSGVY